MGHGTGSGWHCWALDGVTAADWPVVYLGSEGERAKTGRNTSEFLQIALSLAPHFIDAIDRLPGIDPHGGDISVASEAVFNVSQIQAWIEGIPRDEHVEETVRKANMVLDALG